MNKGYTLENTTFGIIFNKITAEGKKPVRFDYEAKLHTVKDDIDTDKILTIDIYRGYDTQICDKGMISFLLPFGTYVKKLYPYRTNLEVTIKEYELEEQGDERRKDKKPKLVRYKAIFKLENNENISARGYENLTKETLDNSGMVTVSLELTDRAAEPLRVITTSGTYFNKTYEEVIRGILYNESKKVLIDGKPSIDGVDIVKPENDTVNKQTLIPVGTKIINVPTFFQEKCEGLYTASVGTYLQIYREKKYWFVFPLHKHKRFTENVPKAIFYAIPQDRYEDIDRTFKEEGDLLQVLAASDRKYTDQADLNNMNEGNGLRVTDAYPMMHKPVEITPEGPRGKRARLNVEVTYNDREDGLNYQPVVDSRISINRYQEYSNVIARNTGEVVLTWKNSNPDLLYPGMPCKFIVMGKKRPIEVKGIIQLVHILISPEQDGYLKSHYRRSCMIKINVETLPKDEDDAKMAEANKTLTK